MKFKNILGIFAAGYATVVAVTMKKRKDSGTSKLAEKATDSTLGEVVDEIVDIHKVAYTGVKNYVVPLFEDIPDFSTLKEEVAEMLHSFVDTCEKTFITLEKKGERTKDTTLDFLNTTYEKVKKALNIAQKKAESFTDTPKEDIRLWIAASKKEMDTLYRKLKIEAQKSSK